MKKILSFLLAVAMTLSLLAGIAVTAGAEATYTYISDVYHSMDGKPKTLAAGQPLPELTPRPTNPYMCYMECAWLDEEEQELPAGTIAEFGKTYCLRAKVYPQDGYAFENYCWIGGYDEYYTLGTLGDGAAELWGDKYYTALNAIEKVEISLEEPKVGEALAKPVVVSGEATSDRSFWVEYVQNDTRVEYGTLAKAGSRYEMFLHLDPKEDYTFTQDTQVLINGKAYEIYDASAVVFYVAYDLRVLLEAFAFDLAQPEAGKPFPQAVVAEDAGYTAKTVWTDLYTDSRVAEDAVVAQDGVYELSVTLMADIMHNVDEEATLTVNGKEPEGSYWANEYSKELHYRQTFCFAQPLEKLEVTYAEPEIGKAPGEITVPEGANYHIDAQTYWNNWDHYGEPVEIFEQGNAYELNLYVAANTGYAITDDTELYINGEKLLKEETSNFITSLYCCQEYSFKTVIDTVALPAWPELKVGDPIPEISGSGEGFDYSVRWDGSDAEGNEVETDVVRDGAVYYGELLAQPKEGCCFAENVSVTIGGKPAGVGSYAEDSEIGSYKLYNFGAGEVMERIDFRAHIPCVGQSGGTVVAPEGIAAEYGWFIYSDGIEDAREKEGPYRAGEQMLLFVQFVTEPGWWVDSDAKITLNGKEYPTLMTRAAPEEGVVIFDLGTPAETSPAEADGLNLVDGIWGYYLDGVLQVEYTGFVPYGDNVFYVENGILDFTYTGLAWYIDQWRYVANSLLTEGYTGLVYFNDNWFYVVDSRIDWTFTGVVEFGGNYFYVHGNLLNFDFTGMALYEDVWCYFQNSLLMADYTGLVCVDGSWFYVKNGRLTWDYVGLAEYNGNKFYVQNSMLDWSYTGLGYHDGGWYFIQNGLLMADYTGLVYFGDTWYYIENGRLTWTANGLVLYNGDLFYIANSLVDWSYNGPATYNGNEYTVINGFVDLPN